MSSIYITKTYLLLLFSGGFGNSSWEIFGKFRPFLGSFWAVFRQKKTDWIAQSVFLTC
jgi:hypothetical protein